MAEPSSKPPRVLQRTKAACLQCRQHKQKCDGEARIPCRRCELYGLECTYLPASGSAGAGVARPVAAAAPAPLPRTLEETLVADGLREITDRLRSIESSLFNARLSTNQSSVSSKTIDTISHVRHSIPLVLPPLQAGERPSWSQPQTDSSATAARQQVNASADVFSWLTGNALVNSSPSRRLTMDGGPSIDAIERGIMTVDEVESTFDVFHRLLSPWLLIFDRQRDTDALAMRDRSPLLFHVVLLSATYYRIGSSSRAASLYDSLLGIVNELIAPMLVSTQPYHLTSDFVRALCVLTLYKPIDFAPSQASAVSDPVAAEHASKLNPTSSSTIWSFAIRTARTLNLPSVPSAFLKTYQPNAPITPPILNDFRLWAWLSVVDTHACLTTGRAGLADPTDLVKMTRPFALLKSQLGDVRLAAMVELYAIVRKVASSSWYTIIGGTGDMTPVTELRKFNSDVEEWEAFWSDKLEEAAREGDTLAGTVVCTFSNFVKVIVNSSVFTRWRNDRKESLARGGNGRPELLDHDWEFIRVVLDSMEHLIFSVSVESRVAGSLTQRKVAWPQGAQDEPRKPLTLDETAVNCLKTAFDAITCVVYVYPLILVARMVNAGLVRCELLIERAKLDYALGVHITRPRRLVSGVKFGVLLELGAKLLDAIAPTPSHPARRHAKMLRAIFATGIIGQSNPIGPGPGDLRTRLLAVLDPVQFAVLAPTPSPWPVPGFVAPFNPPSDRSLEPVLPQEQNQSNNSPVEAGEALASLLGRIDREQFGDFASFGGEDLGGVLDGVDAMVVDWDTWEGHPGPKTWHAEGAVLGGEEEAGLRRL